MTTLKRAAQVQNNLMLNEYFVNFFNLLTVRNIHIAEVQSTVNDPLGFIGRNLVNTLGFKPKTHGSVA